MVKSVVAACLVLALDAQMQLETGSCKKDTKSFVGCRLCCLDTESSREKQNKCIDGGCCDAHPDSCSFALTTDAAVGSCKDHSWSYGDCCACCNEVHGSSSDDKSKCIKKM